MGARRPILVTGSHRSGTTWVGKMLALPPNIYYIHEPFHPRDTPGLCQARFEHWFQYVYPGNEALFLSGIEDMLHLKYPLLAHWRESRTTIKRLRVIKRFLRLLMRRLVRPRILMKDPIALMSAEWLHTRFDMEVVVLIRHPAAFAGSIKRHNQSHPFQDFWKQEVLMRDYLSPFEAEIRNSPPDLVDQAILLWRILYYVVDRYRQKWPQWCYLRHEDLCMDPVQEFGKLYARLGIDYSEAIQQKIISYSAPSNPPEAPDGVAHYIKLNSRATVKSWKNKLSREEIIRIRDGTADVYYSFYSDKDWE